MNSIRNLVRKLRRHGALNVLHDIAMRLINAVVVFKTLRGVYVAQPDAAYMACPKEYSPRFLSEEMLRNFAQDAGTEISDRFLDEARSRGDECYALLCGDVLAAYGWYSCNATPIGLQGLVLRFDPRYVYMYKGFTHDAHRGKRLHAIGMTRALGEYLGKGREGMVSYVESTNFDSLKSCFRMGYIVFGSIYIVRIFGHYFTAASPGCKRFAFRVEVLSGQHVPGLTLGKT